jgi:hypothetical protein
MSYDLEYLLVQCSHRYVDDVLQSAVDLEAQQIAEGAFYGIAQYGTPTRYGPDTYSIPSPTFGTTGQYFVEPNGFTVAILPLKYTSGGAERLFIQYPFEYNRREVPKELAVSFEQTTHFGTWHFGDTDAPYGGQPLVFGGQGLESISDGFRTLWYVNASDQTQSRVINDKIWTIPTNHIIIFVYDNTVNWVADYTSRQDSCPVCHRTGTKNDIEFGQLGKLNIVERTEKLAQAVSKAILTDKGTNAYFPNYGTIINDLLGEATDLTRNFVIRSEIFEQLSAMRKQYDLAVLMNPRLYSPFEIIEDLVAVDFFPTTDPRNVNIQATVLSRSLDTVRTKRLSATRR